MDDACNNFGPLFKSRLDLILNQSTYSKAFYCAHQIIKPVLQVGPTCGFAALSNALNTYNLNSPSLNDLVELGRSDGITNNGELFSVDWLCNFIQKYWTNLNPKIAKFSEMDLTSIIEYFGKKRENEIPTILIPYDCDRGNFEPCNRNGVGAHWAILTGFLLLCDYNDGAEPSDLCSIKMVNSSTEFNDFSRGLKGDENCLYLIAYQGKSCHPAIWSFQTLLQSNAQLNMPAEGQNNNKNNNFCLPPEGMAMALKGKCLLLGGGSE
ncbi:hypothetical protein ACQ4LE_006920 [Meloidogyne hapla]|uniref:Actin maturation protease n=1 Tax=Meloidogyne hapla TaxID=6305 RepID=A0A1I8B0B0_MELHA